MHESFFKEWKKKKKSKWRKALFSKETKVQIFERDKHCLFCPDAIQDYHHIFYGWNAEYWEERNNVDKWVWLCRHHHELIHHFTDWSSQSIREQCIRYLKEYYERK